MISVIIPTKMGERRDGIAFADSLDPIAMEYGYTSPDAHHEDFAVRIVPRESLQALLRGHKSFAAYETRFGAVLESERHAIIGLFKLMEAARSGEDEPRKEYLVRTLGKLKSQRKEIISKASRTNSDAMVRYFFERDRKGLADYGPLGVLVKELQGVSTLRLWQNDSEPTLSIGLSAEDFPHALRVHLLLLLQDSESIALCKRCSREYTRTKTTQVFCCGKCGNNDRQARYRSKGKENSSHGTHKTR